MTDSPINWENLITDSRNIVGENVLKIMAQLTKAQSEGVYL